MTQKKNSFQDYQTVLDAINFQKQDDKIAVWQTVLIPLSGPKTITKKTLKNYLHAFFTFVLSTVFPCQCTDWGAPTRCSGILIELLFVHF